MSEPISEERLRNTLAWATARLRQLSGAEVIVGAITEVLERRAADENPASARRIPILARTFRLDADGLRCGFCRAPIPVASEPRRCCADGHAEDERNKPRTTGGPYGGVAHSLDAPPCADPACPVCGVTRR
jgi:hypothetical protein